MLITIQVSCSVLAAVCHLQKQAQLACAEHILIVPSAASDNDMPSARLSASSFTLTRTSCPLLQAVEALMQEGDDGEQQPRLPVNIKFLLEGQVREGSGAAFDTGYWQALGCWLWVTRAGSR